MKIQTTGIETDINRENARRAYHAISFSPERRGDSVVDGYIETMKKLAEFIEGIAISDEQKEKAQSVFDGLRQTYLKKQLAWLSAQSRCMSSMITGPANFPVRRAEKANASERKRSDEWLDFHNKLEKLATKSLTIKTPTEATGENTSEELEGITIVRNKDEDRLQLIFSGKPSEEIRTLLKSRGFRWSPRFGAWQRQLTANAEYALKILMPQIV